MELIRVVKDRDQWPIITKTIMNPWVSQDGNSLLACRDGLG